MSNDKNDKLPTVPKQHAVQLHNNGLKSGSLIEQALTSLNTDQMSNLMTKAAEEALRLEVKGREQGLDYVTGKKAIEDHIDTFAMLEKGKEGKFTTVRQSVVSNVKTGAGNMQIESKSGASCFVATVAYENADHANVRFLRAFRDEFLAYSSNGRAFIGWYWRVGPRLALIVGNNALLKWFTRCLLSLIIVSIGLFWNANESNKIKLNKS
ncbi:MAG: hypothetical protein KDC92_15715 [Bacteroidetes bacterium]|nr:hypothetical protein [Bacteroidota bacterium]MCB1659626.1 hypothetical protein [Pseudomonadales bacterium]